MLKTQHVIIGIAVLCFIIYGKSINNSYNIDDNYVCENHEMVKEGISSIPNIFTSRYHTKDEHYFGYRPLSIAIFAIEYDIFVNIIGVSESNFPHVGHFFNIIYYILCASILFFVLQYLFKDKEYANIIPLISVILFIVHPIHTEVVLSLKNREEILMTIFGLLALYQAIRYYETKKILRILSASALIALAYLTKESAIVFLAIIPLSILFFRTNQELNLNSKINKPNLVFFLAQCATTILMLFNIGDFYLWGNIEIQNPLSFSIDIGMYITALFFILLITNIVLIIKHQRKTLLQIASNMFFIIGTLVFLSLILIPNSTILLLAFIILDIHIYTQIRNRGIKSENAQLPEFINKKWVKPVFISIVSLASLIILISILQNLLLPETNAPVYKWQNPIFDFSRTLGEKLAIALYSMGYYIKLLFIPNPLRFYYGYKMIPEVGLGDLLVILSMIIHTALIVFAIKGFNKRNLISFAILFYLITISPFSNIFFPLTGIIGERLLFLPSIGFVIAISALFVALIKRRNKHIQNDKLTTSALFLTFILVIPASTLTIQRNDDWKNRKTLYEHDIKHLENSAKVNNLYANYVIAEVYAYMKMNRNPTEFQDKINLAIKHYKQAIKIDPTYTNPAHNLGYIYLIIGKDYKLAKTYFNQCIANDSTLNEAYLNRGIANYYLNYYEQCIEDLVMHESLANDSHNADKIYYYTGKSQLALGDTIESKEFFLKTITTPNVSKVIINDIKELFVSLNDYPGAIVAVDELIKTTPEVDQLYVDKGNYYLLYGDTISAITNWGIAVEKYPGNFNIGMTLSQYYLGIGELEKSNYYYAKVIEYRNSHPNN